MFGIKTDPTPYITAAYAVGILLIVGFSVLQLRFRKKLKALEDAMKE